MKKQLLLTILALFIINVKAISQTSPTATLEGNIDMTDFYTYQNHSVPFSIIAEAGKTKLIIMNKLLEKDKEITLNGHYTRQTREGIIGGGAETYYYAKITHKYDTYGLTARYCPFTQTLFNDDEQIELLRTVFDDQILKRFEVVSEKGDVLTTYTPPQNIAFAGIDYYAYTVGGNKYLVVCFYDDYGNDLYTFYPAEAGTSTNVKTYQPLKTMAYPNPVNRSEPLTIQLANPASTNTYVELFTINGTRAGRYKINEGEQQFSLPTTKLSAGQYIYHISAGGKRVNSGKVVVK